MKGFNRLVGERVVFYHFIELNDRMVVGMGSSKKKAKEMAAWKDMIGGVLKMNRDNWKHNYDHQVSMGWIKDSEC